MKASLHHFLLFLIGCILFPCSVNAFDTALFIPRSDAFWTTFASYTQTASKSIGLNLDVYDAKENPETMLNQADRVCRQGVDAIIFMNYQGIGESILQVAEKYKTPAFLVNTSFKVNTFAPRGKYQHWIGELTADDRQAGTLLARRLAEVAGKRGIKALNIFAFQGREKDIASILRLEGLKNFIALTDKAELVATEPANWDRKQAKTIFRRVLLEYPQINVIWGANDRMAQGAAEAARELKIEKPMVYGGINWGLDALRALDRGIIDIDVGGHIFDGALAAIMVFDYLKGYDFANEKMRFTSNMVAITQSNINKFNTIFVRPGMIDFRSLSMTHNPKLLQYNFDLNSIADRVEPAQESLTQEELAWIGQHPIIRVGNETDWPPFDFAEDGKAMGYAIDFLRLAGKKVGLSFEFVNGYSWNELMTGLHKEEILVLPVVAKTPKRLEFMEFTSSYMDATTVVVTRSDEKAIKEISDLAGKRLAVVKGSYYEESVVRHHPKVMIIQATGFREGLDAVLQNRADAFIGNEAVINYTLGQYFLSGLKVVGRTGINGIERINLHMGVPKRQKILASILDKGIQAISNNEKQALLANWSNFRILSEKGLNPLQFTQDEQAFLDSHPIIRMGIMDAWPPFDFIDEKGKPGGIGVSYINAINRRLNNMLKIVPGAWTDIYNGVKAGTLDALMDITPKPSREEFFNFTTPYLTVPHVIVAPKDTPFLNNEEDLQGKTLALEKGFGNVNYFRNNYPGIKIKEYRDTALALDAVARGEADAYAGNRAVALYLMAKEIITNLKVHGRLKKEGSILAMGTRKDWPILRDILEKALDDISQEEKYDMAGRWVEFEQEKPEIPKVDLTREEKAWLNQHPVIRVSNELAWPPFDFMKNGREAGISIEYIKLLAKHIGVKLEFVQGDWKDLLDKFKEKQIDLIHPLRMTEDRKPFTLFTPPHIQLNNVLVVRNTDTKTRSLEDLNGKTLAICKGWASHRLIKESYPDIKFLIVKNTYEGLMAVSKNRADAYTDSLTVAEYVIRKQFLKNLKILYDLKTHELGHLQLHLGTRNDWPVFHGILNKAMESVTFKEIEEIYGQWGLTFKQVKPGLTLTAREQAFIKEHPILRLGYDIDWYPVEFVDNQGRFSGLAADYMTRIEGLLGMKIEPLPPQSWQEMVKTARAGELEIMPALVKTPQRAQYLDFTTPFLNFPMVMVTREETHYLSDMNGLRGKRVAAVSGYFSFEVLRERHPELDLMPVATVREGLMAVNRKKAFAFVGNMATISHILGQEGLGRLKISGETPYSYHLSMAVRKDLPVLTGLIQKALDAITQEERSAISRKWFSITYKRVIDYTLIWKVLAGAFLVCFGIFFWNRKLSYLNQQLESAQKAEHQALLEAESSNRQLQKANDRLKELDLLKSMFIASMSHELRTPLNSIIGFSGLMIQGLSGRLSEEQKDNLNRIHKAGTHLLALISDVIDISKIEAGRIDVFPEEVSLKDLVEEAVETIRPQADAKGLTLSVEAENWPVLHTDHKRLLQCLLNFIGNAVKYSEKGRITLSVSQILTDVEIRVQDTGIGIAQKDLPRLFNAFERLESHLRVKAGGTGLGLYLTRKIATDLLQGSVRVESKINEGSIFYLKIPIDLNTKVDK